MKVFLIVVLALLVIIGNALILLRTAKKLKIPDSVKSKPFSDNDDRGW